MSGTKREAEQEAGGSEQQQQEQSNKAEGPDIKRVRLDDGPSLSLASDSGDATPSSPTTSFAKSKNERNNRGGGQQQRGGRGGGRGGRGSNNNSNSNYSRGSKGKQREWGPRKDSNDPANLDSEAVKNEDTAGEGKSKIPKKKVALLIGYSGLGYSGSQVNPGVKTIESEVFEACVKVGAISEDNSDSVNKVSLMRAARTDAGVSAAINVLNLKLILNPPNKPEDMPLEDYINTFLPPTIRVWSVIRVQGGFHARTMCDSRMYNYSLPTYCFLEPRPETAMGQKIERKEGETSWWASQSKTDMVDDANKATQAGDDAPQTAEASTSGTNTEDKGKQGVTPALSSFKEDQILRKAYRIPPDLLDRVNQLFQAFLGSHNFWNFTVGKEFKDRSCQRVMKNLTLTEPFMVNDQEWISLKFHGQSFMLHQIRKMVALIILCARTGTPPSLIPETFGPARLNIPKAPALGLLLEQPHFDSYNRKVIYSNSRIQSRMANSSGSGGKDQTQDAGGESPSKANDESQLVRDLIDYKNVEDKVEQFKRDVILKTMYNEEDKEDTFALWLSLHDGQLGPDFDYLNGKGVIPQSAVMGKNKAAQQGQVNDPSKGSQSPGTASAGLPAAIRSSKPEEQDEEDALLARLNSGKEAADLDG